MYFDTHAHYDDGKFDADRDAVLSSLPEKGVELVMNAACDLPTMKSSVELAERYPFVYAAVGIHPHDADTLDDALGLIESLCSHEKVKAIGEIGLDYHYDFSPRDVQKKAFAAQMELARSLDMPVIVHDREAHADCLETVRRFKGVRGVFHCFSGSAELADELVKMGWYISFTGAITFKNAKKAAQIVASLPEDRIMIETDCPYMTPEPFRGRRNDSSYLEYICSAVAAFRGISQDRAAALTAENGRRFFSI